MPTPKPNDRTTPPSTPSTPRSANHSQPPQPNATVSRATHRNVCPRDLHPAAWPHDLRPSREYGAQDGLHDRFTWETGPSSSREIALQVASDLSFYSLRIPSNKTISSQNLPVRPSPKKEILRFITPALPLEMPASLPSSGSPSKSSAKTSSSSKAGPATKATGWVANIRKKKRPIDLFNPNFSFNAASTRCASEWTPPVSPRSSFSSASCSSTSFVESSKRQRMSSLVPNELISKKPISVSTAPSTRPAFPAVEAHPGQLVDFSTPNYDIPLQAPCKSKYTESAEAHQDYFASLSRRRSFPGEYQAELIIFDPLDAELKNPFSAPRRKRASTYDRKPRLHPINTSNTTTSSSHSNTPSLCSTSCPSTPASADAPSTPIALISAPASSGSGSLRRTISDPSAEAFLRHIRKSLEARKSAAQAMKWQDYPVFADEAERGFLDDAPL